MFNTQKYDKEIGLLQATAHDAASLHPLRREQIKQEVMQSITHTSQTGMVTQSLPLKSRRWVQALASVFGSLALLGGTAFAAQESLPGDALYPVKRAAEKVQLAVTLSETAKAELKLRQAEERLDELGQIKAKAEAIATAEGGTARAEASLDVSAESRTIIEIEQALDSATKVEVKVESNNPEAAKKVKEHAARLRAQAQALIEEQQSAASSTPESAQPTPGKTQGATIDIPDSLKDTEAARLFNEIHSKTQAEIEANRKARSERKGN